ncbi:MAG: hypothetical protein ACE5LU_29795, partial [Anaerolineae bacterium]
TMMGFKLELADGTTIALRPAKAHGAPVPVNLETLLSTGLPQNLWVGNSLWGFAPDPRIF